MERLDERVLDSLKIVGSTPEKGKEEAQRPKAKPKIAPLPKSDLLSRCSAFLPLMQHANSGLFFGNVPSCEPVCEEAKPKDIMVPAADSSSDSESSIGSESDAQKGDGMDVSSEKAAAQPAQTAGKTPEVEMEIGLGVFDVNGAVDEEAMRRQNIDIVDEVAQPVKALIEEVQDTRMEDADGSAPSHPALS